MKIVRLNSKPSKPDARDLAYAASQVQLPNYVNLKEFDSNVENQGNLGSCTSNAITNGYELMVKILYPDSFVELSRLFVYYHSRLFSDDLDNDAGAYIRDGLKSIKNYGVCAEELWPYNIEKYDDQPYPRCYLDATKRKITSYNILFTNEEIKEVLSGKRPVVVCIEIFYEFNDVAKENPYVTLPNTFAYSLGNHAILLIGYDDSINCFLMKNSYGNDWGDNGYGFIPYDYITEYACERWCFEINTQDKKF